MFLIFFATSFCMDFCCVLALISPPFWEPFGIKFHVFSRVICSWFFGWYFSLISMVFGPKGHPILNDVAPPFPHFSDPVPSGCASNWKRAKIELKARALNWARAQSTCFELGARSKHVLWTGSRRKSSSKHALWTGAIPYTPSTPHLSQFTPSLIFTLHPLKVSSFRYPIPPSTLPKGRPSQHPVLPGPGAACCLWQLRSAPGPKAPKAC